MKNTIILFNKNLPNQPIIIYENMDKDKVWILKENKGKTGIKVKLGYIHRPINNWVKYILVQFLTCLND